MKKELEKAFERAIRKNPVAKALRVTRRKVINSKKLYKREKVNVERE